MNIGASIIYSLASVPIAINYLNKELFGLWALAAQVSVYLCLLEMGLGLAINRCIADHKDNVQGVDYAQHLSMGAIVYLIQGLLIATLGVAFAPLAPDLFSVPPQLEKDFHILLVILACTSGLTIATRVFGMPLWAFHRIDVLNYCFSGGILLSLLTLWWGFYVGLGVMAFPISQIPQLIVAPAVHIWVCSINKYYPPFSNLLKPKWRTLYEIFSFGRDNFLIQVGRQLIDALQLIVIGKFIGLAGAATYAISSKTYSMSRQLLAAPINSSETLLTEMHIRDENDKFHKRYQDLLMITIMTATIIATGIVTFNREFVAIWTNGKIHWTWLEDLALGLNMLLKSIIFAMMNAFGVIKNYQPVRYIYGIECAAFLLLGITGAKYGGIAAVIGASTIIQLFLIFPILLQKIHLHMNFRLQIVRPLIFASLMITLSSLGSVWISELCKHWTFTLLFCLLASTLTALTFYMLLLTESVKIDICRTANQIFTKICHR
ncbi:MAG: lipopolysaccharide biosynthesis protein [Akkermansiaceae bacterium]|jgi:O-antigen/teichoic acid export membrane protein